MDRIKGKDFILNLTIYCVRAAERRSGWVAFCNFCDNFAQNETVVEWRKKTLIKSPMHKLSGYYEVCFCDCDFPRFAAIVCSMADDHIYEMLLAWSFNSGYAVWCSYIKYVFLFSWNAFNIFYFWPSLQITAPKIVVIYRCKIENINTYLSYDWCNAHLTKLPLIKLKLPRKNIRNIKESCQKSGQLCCYCYSC